MIYIKLFNSIQGYDIVRIKEFHFFDSDDNERTPMSVGFRYQVCNEEKGKYSELYNKFITIEDKDVLQKLFFTSAKGTPYDNVCRVFLEYIISKGLEKGTLEIK